LTPTLTERIRHGLLVFIATVTCGYAVFYGYYLSRVNSGFHWETDIIGYPAFGNYNNYALFYGYVLGLLAAVATLLLLLRYVDLQRLEGFLPRLPATVLTSPIIGFALVLKGRGTWYGWATIAFVTLTLCRIAACAIDRQLTKRGKSAWSEGSLSIALAMAIPALLFYVSQNTGWQTPSGNIAHARWFPVPILIVAELLVLAWGIRCLRRAGGAQLFDSHFIRFMLIPVLIYLLTADLPGARTLGDDFHGGERLAPLALGLRGALPWRDFLFIHGIWDDFLQLYIPARLWEPTLRAGVSGTPFLFGPIYWGSFYLFFLTVFEFSLLPALLAFFISIALVFPDPFRFLLYPVVLLCLYKALRSKGTILWVLLIGLCGLQVLLAPEFALLAVCLGSVIVLRDLLERDRQQPWARQFYPTLVCGATAAIFILVAVGLLTSLGMFDGFLMMAVQLARGHLQTGGIPVQPIENLLWVTGIPLIFMVGSTLVFLQTCLRSRREVPVVVWVLWGLTLCTAIYYPKYIGRPDLHIGEVYAVAQPGIALFTVFLFEQARRSLQTRYRPWVLTSAGIFVSSLVLVYGVPGVPWSAHLADYVLQNTGSFRSRFISTNQDTDFSALQTNTTTAAKAAALGQFFAAHLHSGDAVFDFSDSPTTFFAILQLKPASRFIHISLAIQEELQREVVQDLEKSRPPYVIYQSEGGLNGWDGIPNEVRHYLVARYINLHYVYDRTIEGSVIFRRADVPGELRDDGGAERLLACPLGYTPNVFSPRTPPHDRESALTARPPTTYLQLDGWAALPAGDSPPEVVVSYKGTVLDRFTPNRIRPDVDKALGRTLGQTGFSRHIALPDPAISAGDIDISGRNAATDKLFHFQEGPLRGWIDSSIVMPGVLLIPPRGERPAYLALQFSGDATREPQEFSITSAQSDDARITFTKIGRDDELMLPLGGCYAWGAISKSVPQVSSSKPFTLKSAFYYYE
jgi:hypothetical protein